ncbi:TetR/AcrR family transcriptional regulator [Mycolicibacterium vaccae]|uniref:TetR/AcrR family transcriptional regulator n=1 Tax=Mycolicibacterium vaccae TaxID=1810 RepID=UPI003D033805
MAERLASGRHNLSREQVSANQKQRLFKALGAVMSTKGYNNTTVEDLITEAGVSRATFYQHFTSKLDCFMSAFARMQRHVISAVDAVPDTGPPMERFSVMLERYLGFMALDPSMARLFLVEVYAAGPDALRRRVELQQEFVAGIAAIFDAHSDEDRFACQMLVAAIAAMVTNALADGDPGAITALHDPILGFTKKVMNG